MQQITDDSAIWRNNLLKWQIINEEMAVLSYVGQTESSQTWH